jgi:ATP-binding cassette subfamily B protein
MKIFFSFLALLVTSLGTLSLGQGLRILVARGFRENELGISIFILLSIGIFVGIGTFMRHYLVSWIGERVSSDLRIGVFRHVIHMEPSFFEDQSAGEIQSRILTDTTLVQTVVGSSLSIFLRNALIFVFGSIWLFFTNPKLTAIVLSSIPFVVFPILGFGKKVKKLSKLTQEHLAQVGGKINESLGNIRTVQAFGQEGRETNQFRDLVSSEKYFYQI